MFNEEQYVIIPNHCKEEWTESDSNLPSTCLEIITTPLEHNPFGLYIMSEISVKLKIVGFITTSDTEGILLNIVA